MSAWSLSPLLPAAQAISPSRKEPVDQLLPLCTRVWTEEGIEPFSGHWLAQINAANHRMAANGTRVLAVAVRSLAGLPAESDLPLIEVDLTFLGLLGMIDPPRAEGQAAVEEGPVVYDNVRRFIMFSIAGNIGKVLTIAVPPFFGLPLLLMPTPKPTVCQKISAYAFREVRAAVASPTTKTMVG